VDPTFNVRRVPGPGCDAHVDRRCQAPGLSRGGHDDLRPRKEDPMTSTQPDVGNEVVAVSDESLREQALRTIKKRRDFHTHPFAYVTVNLAIWAVWLTIGELSGSWWPWPL